MVEYRKTKVFNCSQVQNNFIQLPTAKLIICVLLNIVHIGIIINWLMLCDGNIFHDIVILCKYPTTFWLCFLRQIENSNIFVLTLRLPL